MTGDCAHHRVAALGTALRYSFGVSSGLVGAKAPPLKVILMPKAPKRPCRYPGCPNLCDKGVYCSKHIQFSSDRMRGGADARGYDSRWRKARKYFLEKHPLCAKCMRNGKLTPATVVDHIIPHRGDQQLFWDDGNWQPLCKGCHDRKTGKGM